MLELINQYVDTRLLIIAVMLYVAIEFIKTIPKVKNNTWVVPIVAWFVGVVMTALYLVFVLSEGWTGATLVIAVIQGTFVAALAVFCNQIFKQLTVDRLE